jgi:hypothetical protein
MDDCIKMVIGADIAQVGAVFKATFLLPLEVDGKRFEVTVYGIGDKVNASITEFKPSTDENQGA